MLSVKQKLLILDYAEHDGSVTLTLDEVTQLFEEIERLKDENAKLLASEASTYNENNRLRQELRKWQDQALHEKESCDKVTKLYDELRNENKRLVNVDLEKSIKLNKLEGKIEKLEQELRRVKFEKEYYNKFIEPSEMTIKE